MGTLWRLGWFHKLFENKSAILALWWFFLLEVTSWAFYHCANFLRFQIKIQLPVYLSIPVTSWQEMENRLCGWRSLNLSWHVNLSAFLIVYWCYRHFNNHDNWKKTKFQQLSINREHLSFKKKCEIQWHRLKFGTILKPGIGFNLNRLKLHVSDVYRRDFKGVIYTES